MIKFITPKQKEFLQFVISSENLVRKFKPVLQQIIAMGCYSNTQPAIGFDPAVTEKEILNRIRDNWLTDYKEYIKHNGNAIK